MMHQFIWEHTSQTVSKNQEDSECQKKGLSMPSIPSILSIPQYASVYLNEYVSVCRVYWAYLSPPCLSMPVHPRHLLLYRQPPRRVACEIILEPLCTFCILWPASYFHESSYRINVELFLSKIASVTQLKTCSLRPGRGLLPRHKCEKSPPGENNNIIM